MIYVVSGFMRSGTSMMMNALMAGGITPFYDRHREKGLESANQKRKINPNKFYEVGEKEYMRLGMTTELPDESLVKIMAIGLPILAAGKGYRVVYMRRNPDEIRRSFIDKFPEDNFDKRHPTWPSHYWQLLDGVKGIMEARRDVYLTEFWFDDVLADPEKHIDILIANGWPIRNRRAAIEHIDPAQKRFVA